MVKALAFDLGASSGRAVIGTLVDGKLHLQELHRFSNDPVWVGKRYYWDILRLFHELKQGLLKAHQQNLSLSSIAIDSWAVDYGLISIEGELLGNPSHYRDPLNEGKMEEVFQFISSDDIYSRTGIQFLPFNTIYQLYALKQYQPARLEQADQLLMIPDLLRYFLTGIKKGEFTNASTTQLFNPHEMKWDHVLIDKLGLPVSIFPDVVTPGTTIGQLTPALCEELGIEPTPVIAVAEHDTGSAVVAVPTLSKDFAYLSCGTWSLMGTELEAPLVSQEAKALNFTNEGGINNTSRFLKNIMGLWLIQACKSAWEKEGQVLGYEQLTKETEQAKAFQAFIDPDDLMFLNPAHMPKAIQAYCQETGQFIPQSRGQILRVINDSLALKYKRVLEQIEALTGKQYPLLHMVGGGIQNKLLCQSTANALGRPVWAGPVEGSAIGNLLVQFMALGHIQSLKTAREIVYHSFDISVYSPEESVLWQEAYTTFLHVLNRKNN